MFFVLVLKILVVKLCCFGDGVEHSYHSGEKHKLRLAILGSCFDFLFGDFMTQVDLILTAQNLDFEREDDITVLPFRHPIKLVICKIQDGA
jgi:hypothetical protein